MAGSYTENDRKSVEGHKMNRPKRENFKSHIEYDEFGELEFNGIDDYYEALEKYCDELEKAVTRFTIEILDFPDEDILIEVVCRKLHKYGLIKKEDDSWVIEDE